MHNPTQPDPDQPAWPPSAPIYLVAAHPNWRDSRVNRLPLDAARSQPPQWAALAALQHHAEPAVPCDDRPAGGEGSAAAGGA